jgi:hypothetical protein
MFQAACVASISTAKQQTAAHSNETERGKMEVRKKWLQLSLN